MYAEKFGMSFYATFQCMCLHWQCESKVYAQISMTTAGIFFTVYALNFIYCIFVIPSWILFVLRICIPTYVAHFDYSIYSAIELGYGNNLDSGMFQMVHSAVLRAAVGPNGLSAPRYMVDRLNLNYLHQKPHYQLDLVGEILD